MNVNIVEIHNPEKYKPFCKKYGILMELLPETAVVNMDSDSTGICVNISHGDYHIVPPYMWDVLDGEVILPKYGGYISTKLKIRGV